MRSFTFFNVIQSVNAARDRNRDTSIRPASMPRKSLQSFS